MDLFNNCRICLQSIGHEPIKMTRAILKYVEQELQLKNLIRKQKSTDPTNLCAACFNKLAEFQDFHEQCKEADEYWKTQFPTECDNPKPVLESNNLPSVTKDARNNIYVAVVSSTKESADMQLNQEPKQEEEDELLLTLPINENGYATESNEGTDHHENNSVDNVIEEDEYNAHMDVTETWSQEDDDTSLPMENKDKYNDEQEIINFEYEGNDGEQDDSQSESSTAKEVENENNTYVYQEDNGDDNGNEDEDIYKLIQQTLNKELHATTSEPKMRSNTQNSGPSTNTYVVTTVLDENGKVKKSYQCQHCDRAFDRIYDIESHYNIHSDVKPFKCEVCGKCFRQKNILTTHQTLHFGKKVECPQCDKKFARRSQLILHSRMHRDEKPFVCEYEDCKAAFRQRQHLVDHTFIHTGEKQFECSTCSKAFQTRKRLQDHLYKVHSGHRYSCYMCEKTFLKPHLLKIHLFSAHKVAYDDVSHLKMKIDQNKAIEK
ncbi:zinc finger protein 28 homolog [Musca domestica]|uniref:Zinc finger protein 28 homolog n=1 Tax=Musca domestica TaxID=7370 RepID=A0ABM3URP4_MUSDO|nr:zinc finger protein 28 homolog [Musca domestica]